MRTGARMERWARLVVTDPGTIRRGVLYVAIISIAASSAVALFADSGAAWVTLVIPAVALAAWRLRRWRAWLFGLVGGVAVFYVPASHSIWPAAAGLLYLAVHEERGDWPWPAAVCGVAAGSLSLVWFRGELTPLIAVCVVAGLGLGVLVRSLDRLDDETQTLRLQSRHAQEQARWLEQRTSLARELHDVVGHHVTAMVVQTEAGLVGDPRTALETIGDLGRQALTDLDSLVVHLRDPDSPLAVTAPPRLSDIDELLAAPLRHAGVDVSVRVDPQPGLDEVGVLTAYRIAQEALTNVTRHSRARSAWVELARHGDQVRLRVSDDGIGPPTRIERGAGLVGIEERVRAVAGSWDLSERPGGGTILDVLLPVT